MNFARRIPETLRVAMALVLWMTTEIAFAIDASFLEANVNVDGSIAAASDSATSYQSTVESLHTLIELDESDVPYFDGALVYLANAGADDSTENVALRAVVRYRKGLSVESEMTALIERRNLDGGFGTLAGYDSTPFDTAHVLTTLTLTNQLTSEILGGAIGHLLSQQAPGGGWSLNEGNTPSLEVTALVLDSLRRHALRFDLSSSMQNASDYLYRHQGSNGSWGSFELTARALLGVIPVTADVSRYSDSLAFLEQGKSINQSWDDDVYVTALVLRALQLPGSITLPVDPANALIAGEIIDNATRDALGDVVVSLAGPQDLSALTSPDGSFLLSASETGSYTVTYSKPGYLSAGQSFNLERIRNLNMGVILLTPIPDTNPQFANISGRIREASSGAPLAGATVTVSGASSATAVTDGGGSYGLQLNTAGVFVVTVSKEGYQSVSGSGSIELGNSLTFSPQVYKNEENPPADASLSARIVDDAGGQPINGALVVIEQPGQSPLSELSFSNGGVRFDQLVAGSLLLSVSADGYQPVQASVIVSAGSDIDVGDLRLRPAPTSVTVSGRVTRSLDNTAIPGARIEIVGTPVNVDTDANGFYQLEDIDQLDFSVRFSATGFESTVAQVSLQSFQAIGIDQQLDETPLNTEGIGISHIEPVATTYGAYEKAMVAVDFYNNTEELAQLQMVMEVSNSSGYFERFPAIHQPLPGDISDSILLLPAQAEDLRVEFDWMTAAIPPGEYQVTVQAYDLDTLKLQAEKATDISIREDRRILRLVAHSLPSFSYFQAEETVTLSMEVGNASNVPFELPLIYRWRHPDGTVLNEGELTIPVTPQDTQLMIDLAQFVHTFDREGEYLLDIEIGGDVIPDLITTGKISVAPAVRIDPSLSVDPQTIVPDGEKRIRLDIKLSGRDEG